MKTSYSNPHDALLERAWQNCRAGMALCERDEQARNQALAFSQRAHSVAPAHMQRWLELLCGAHAAHVRELYRTENFFALARTEQAWWDQLVQSHPFASIVPRGKKAGAPKASHLNKARAMTLEQFDHICRAAAAIASVKKVYAFGANAIIPWLANSGHSIPLPGFLPSRELDISVGNEKLDSLIDGAIGELSAFDETFSVYAHGVSLATFQAPNNWRKRAGKRTEPVSGIEIVVPHPHDLMISKLVAGRPKDFDFATRVHELYPMTEEEVEALSAEFRQAHPEALPALQAHLKTWRSALP